MPSKQSLSGILPPEMEGKTRAGHSGSPADWPRSPPPSGDTIQQGTEKGANRNTRANFKPNVNLQNTIRTVTPEPAENGHASTDTNTSQPSRTQGTSSPQKSSPRSVPAGERRRQGVLFNEQKQQHGRESRESYDSGSSSPPQRATSTTPSTASAAAAAAPTPTTTSSSGSSTVAVANTANTANTTAATAALRPRTHTMDGALALRQQTTASAAAAASPADSRHRVGSFSAGSQPFTDIDVRPPPTVLESVPFPTLGQSRTPELKITVSSNKEKKSNRRLLKRASSRPTSPLVSPPPTVDSLPLPVPTNDANKILLLMKTLCGRMKGEVEYQNEPNGPWYLGVCYIDEDKGSLLFDAGHNGPFQVVIVADLRGCRVLPVDCADNGAKCLELYSPIAGAELLLRPLAPHELDLWLASLLCWQQLRPGTIKPIHGRGGGSPATAKSDTRRRGSSAAASLSKDAAIIKVGRVMLWDKGAATSPRAIVRRPSTRDLRSGSTSWRGVSCMLQDNGQFKLMTENDVAVLSVIELTQLSRSAVQQLDKSVLDEEYCIAIFPIYASTSTQLSIFRPVYLALDSRVLFEVWFVLLRAFTVPDLYGIDPSSDQVKEIRDADEAFDGQLFRVEKTIEVRVTEAKILRRPSTMQDQNERHAKDRDPLIGNYLAEVILDGEVRSRTTTQPDTKNPFWRENAQFTELPSALPYLSIILKRVEGNMETFTHQLQATLGLAKSANPTEVICGTTEVPLERIERAKDHEQWFPVYDEKSTAIGSVFVKVNHDELVVLTSKDYKPLSELLHKFSTGLTGQIAHAMPSVMRRLAETFLNIFQVSGAAHEWLMALVEDEIDGIGNQNNSMKRLRYSRRIKSNESSNSASDREQLVRDMGKSLAGEANLLFRGNTLLTQALEFHMRRLGKEYLEDILSEKIYEINEINPDCEVDPSRIQNPEEMQSHWSQLMELTTEIWECIAISATKLPPELRQVLKYVRAVAEDRYGDFLRTVNYTSVSGFLFLRFICPAILNPKLFGLLRDHPRPRAQRTLTLIAKGLQALANLTSFGKKESWMEPMNKFLSIHRQSFKDYIDQMCSIPTERGVFTLPASYSTPITILGRLSPVSREGFPSLPYLIDHQRNYAALVKLWLEAYHASSAEPQTFEGELAEFHVLCVGLQERSDECLQKIEVHRIENESVISDDLAESLEKASLIDSGNQPFGTTAHAWAEHDPYRPPGSSGSEHDSGDKSGVRNHGGNHRNMSDGSDLSNPLANLRFKTKNARDPRTFLSSLIGKKGKEHSSHSSHSHSMSATMRERQKESKEDKVNKSIRGAFPESWQQNDSTSSRH
ncbi:hypothetical protein F5X96DRAFT_668378 [Biscogniauxia mediterranea]|nr:hypothetical protein F5X96DRAFT_668378 [Biscogniauxia mediterranea]